MSIEIRGDYKIPEVRLRLAASDGSAFIMDVAEDGLRFYSEESSAGHSHGKPVHRSVDDIWDWIGGSGDRVALMDRAVVKRSRVRSKR